MDGAGAKRPGRVGLFLHVDLNDLAAMGADVTAHTEANLDISDDTLWALLAGAEVTPILTDTGTPLSYGRTRRLSAQAHPLRLGSGGAGSTQFRPSASGATANRRGVAEGRCVRTGAPEPKRRHTII
jgi:hypothetical protein